MKNFKKLKIKIMVGSLLIFSSSVVFCQDNANLIDTRDGNTYQTVNIGPQKWMSENLNTDRFVNGEKIPEVKSFEAWISADNEKRPAWCYYNFDSINAKTYGKLYNYSAVHDPRGLAPSGWKIPSIEDWRKLEKSVNSTYPYIGSIDLILMSSTNWKNGENGNDLFNFNAQPGGYVTSSIFSEIGEIAYFWSTQKKNNDNIIEDNVYLRFYLSSNAFQEGSCRDAFDGSGFSVRCLSMEEQPISKNKKVHLENKFFDGMSYIDSIHIKRYPQDVILSEKDTSYFFDNNVDYKTKVKPFYISDHEVTNGEYREFVNWVRDSIAREKLARRYELEERRKWIKTVTYNSGKKDGKGNFYILNWNTELDYNDPTNHLLLSDMYYDEAESYYPRREIDTRLLFFDYYDDESYKNKINVYPDTICWTRDNIISNGEHMAKSYFWREDYINFPVVGLTFEQAKAYCVWRTMMYHYQAGRASKNKYDPSLKFRLPNKEEWERAAMNYYIPNKKTERNEIFPFYPITNGYETNLDGNYQANFGAAYLRSGILIKNYNYDGISTLCKVKSYDVNFNGLYCMYGNVAEWVNTNPEVGNFHEDYFNYFRYNSFRYNSLLVRQDSSKSVKVYITNPYTDSTFFVEKGSEQHKDLIQKRLDFYKVSADDSFEEVKRKFLALNSVDESYKSKINELNNPKKSSPTDTIKPVPNGPTGISGVIDGVVFKEWYDDSSTEVYDIISGIYYFVDTEGGSYDFYTLELYPSFTKFKQNVSALKRAENPLHRSYIINSNLIDKCRLVKGGSFIDEPHYLLLNNSQVYNKDDASFRIGFRIAADVIGNEMNKYDKKRIKKLNKLGFYHQRNPFKLETSKSKKKKLKKD